MTLRIYSELKTGIDGKEYGLRHLLSLEELAGLQRAGLVGEVGEVVQMQREADEAVAMVERDCMGGRVQ